MMECVKVDDDVIVCYCLFYYKMWLCDFLVLFIYRNVFYFIIYLFCFLFKKLCCDEFS